MPVPLVDLRAQYLSLGAEVQDRIGQVLDKMHLFLGENVEALEHEFAAYCNAAHGVGVGSGTDALVLALRALDVGPGDEVITVSHTFVATAEAIVLVGARPVFVDIDPDSYTMDPERAERAISQRTRAIIPVHLYGHPANMEPLHRIAERHGLPIIEDAAQAHGACFGGQPAGSLGDVGCFSFYYSKNLGAYGEGGMVVTSDERLAAKVRVLRDHGSVEKYVHPMVGYNARLDEIQAAILRVKLPHLEEWNNRRRELAQMYTQLLRPFPLGLPSEQPWAHHVYHLYVVRSAFRDRLREFLHARGIMTGIHYPIPVHQQAAYQPYAELSEGMPVTEAVAREVLSLPIYPELTPSQVRDVVGAVHDFFRHA